MSTTHDPLPLSSNDTPAVKQSNFKAQFKTWLDRTGLHGKLIAGGSVLGVICAFLPLASISGGGISISVSIIEVWQGWMSFIAYIACGVGAWMLYQPVQHRLHKNFMYGLLGAAGLIVLFALWMAIAARSAIGFGAILNVLTAAAVGAGAFLKAKEEKVF